MNLIQAADLLKNLSDQQLVQANQNPTAVPPYLVLAEMKRREQVRAEFAKAQASQAQNKSVAQQTAENLMQPQQMQQGQPQQQQGQPQQGQPQGIMQAAPPQVAAMAGGGHVARYAEGKAPNLGAYQILMDRLAAIRPPAQREIVPSGPTTSEEFAKLYKFPTVEEKLASAESILGRPDYSEYQKYLDEQRREAEGRKVRLGDALIAAGAAMASNRDNRVGLASLLAQGIGAGSEAYRSAQERKKKDMQAAMLANMALKNMMEQDRSKRIQLASELSNQERGRKVVEAQTIEANRRQAEELRSKAAAEAERYRIGMEEKGLGVLGQAIKAREARDLALMRMPGERRLSPREVALQQAASLASDASSQAFDYLNSKGLSDKVDYLDLAIKNTYNPDYFKGYSAAERQNARIMLLEEKAKRQKMKIDAEKEERNKQKASGSPYDVFLKENQKSFGLDDEALARSYGATQ
jgi:hypothetical protein